RGLEAFEETERLIVVAAHPDDLETMVGGTVALLIERGVRVFSVNCTLGDIGAEDPAVARLSLANMRLQETEAAGQLMGIEHTVNLGYHDGELLPGLELRARLARLYRITQADTLWTFDPFWTGQIHPDHRAAGQAALDAFMPSKMPLYRPEQLNEPDADLSQLQRIFVFATDRDPDVYVDVSAVYHKKLAACMAHTSQFPEGEQSLEWMKELDAERGKTIGVAYAETLKQIDVW
ncbi:MAG: PIG-L deacetylase family protein, partial [Chloroflexota bacterium]